MNVGIEAGYDPTSWIQSNEFLRFSIPPRALDIPRYQLHPLKGEMKGLWAVTVRANWRIIFRFEGNDAFDVELIDYH
jgi:plasmid maintenance system killer protein